MVSNFMCHKTAQSSPEGRVIWVTTSERKQNSCFLMYFILQPAVITARPHWLTATLLTRPWSLLSTATHSDPGTRLKILYNHFTLIVKIRAEAAPEFQIRAVPSALPVTYLGSIRFWQLVRSKRIKSFYHSVSTTKSVTFRHRCCRQ